MTGNNAPQQLGRVLITCGTLTNGGVQRSLVNLLKLLAPHVAEATLLLPSLSGSLLSEVPETIDVILLPDQHRMLHEVRAHPASWRLFVRHPFHLVKSGMKALRRVLQSRNSEAFAFQRIFRETFMARALPALPELFPSEVFDVAIQYAGGQGIWDSLILDQISAAKKLCWIHGDIERFGTGSELQKAQLCAYDRLVAVSEHGRDSLRRTVPEATSRISVVPNPIDVVGIRAKAEEPLTGVTFDKYTFCSVTRLTSGKALDVGLRAAAILKNRGFRFQWLIAGGGAEELALQALAHALDLGGVVRFLGVLKNPYPLMARSDAFLHTSVSEGKSMAITEAMVLGKPILVTRYPSVEDQIDDGMTGVIAELDAESLAVGMESFIVDTALTRKIEATLRDIDYETDTLDRVLELATSR